MYSNILTRHNIHQYQCNSNGCLFVSRADIGISYYKNLSIFLYWVGQILKKRDNRKGQGMPQSQTAALPKHQEEEETDKTKQAQIEQMYEKH